MVLTSIMAISLKDNTEEGYSKSAAFTQKLPLFTTLVHNT
jgi:hypothetical protein